MLQTGVVPPHSASDTQGTHTPAATLQTGVAPEQSASRRQRTQTPAVMLQRGVAPVHAVVLLAEHWAHAPVAWQAGVLPPHSASPAQARQVFDAVSHTGVVPWHCTLDVQGTHVPVVMLHAGVAPVHWAALLAEQGAQAPLAWQAGVAPPQSASPAQARHVCVAPSQAGVVPPHCAFDRQGTQAPDAPSQTGVAPPQRVEFVAEHCVQAPPDWQAGVTPPHSLSPAQPRQIRNAGSHTGVAPPQSASARQPTQIPVGV